MLLRHPLTFNYNNLFNSNLVTQKYTNVHLRAQEYEPRCHWKFGI